jgi:hypothetical protein
MMDDEEMEDDEDFVVVEDDEEEDMDFDPEVERAFFESMAHQKRHADFSLVVPKWDDNRMRCTLFPSSSPS